MKTRTLPFVFFLFGCNNFSGHIEQQDDKKAETAKQDMTGEVQNLKKDFMSLCQLIEESQVDGLDKQKLQELQTSIMGTNIYLDSMKTEMDKLDKSDVNNVEAL